MYTATTPITAVPSVGPARVKALANLAIHTVDDLLRHVPRRYLDLTHPIPIAQCQIGEFTVIAAEVVSVTARRSRRGAMLVTALLRDESGVMPAVWFNQPYRQNMLVAGQKALFAGRVVREWKTGARSLASPLTEKSPRIIPLYPLTKGVTSRLLLQLVQRVLSQIKIVDDVPKALQKRADVCDLLTAFQFLHMPESMDQVRAGHRRLAFDQLYAMQKELARARQERRKQSTLPIAATVAVLQEFVGVLPFALTPSQRRAIWDMAQEMETPEAPMYRLLNGDVGSGKTVVVAALSALVVKAGLRVLYMAPTHILAQQHADTMQQFLKPLHISIGLVTATTKDVRKQVLVGTHALLSESSYQDVGLIIIDEQHRFGVEQRDSLIVKATHANGAVPHVVSLTATPIPRSLALALFGDLDVTPLRAAPRGRKPIDTRTCTQHQIGDAYTAIRQALGRNEQAYVVCPLIEEVMGDGLVLDERRSVTSVWKELSTQVFADVQVGMLHGKMKALEKERVIADFSSGKTKILVSTSVVEVGVDVPNATVMIIEGADRFGIASLHQLRGRVGRGDRQSMCWLVIPDDDEAARQRCQKVASTTDGFALARFDLTQRGPGDLIGLVQKGLNPLFMQDIDVELMQLAHDVAREEIARS